VGWWEEEIEDWMKSLPRARYVPQGALLGPQHGYDEDKPDAVPRPTARQTAKPRQPTDL
jgi:hypothetical protein